MSQDIEYRCTAAGHAPRSLLSPEFAIRVHLRAWAYCPAGESSGHRWERIAATPLQVLASTPVLGSEDGAIRREPAPRALPNS